MAEKKSQSGVAISSNDVRAQECAVSVARASVAGCGEERLCTLVWQTDFLHGLCRTLADENQTICLETLNVKGMQRRGARAPSVQNRSLSRSIADTGWSTLVQYVGYNAEWAGRTVVKIINLGRVHRWSVRWLQAESEAER